MSSITEKSERIDANFGKPTNILLETTKERSKYISNIAYDVKLDLTAADGFSGRCVIGFDVSDSGELPSELIVDCQIEVISTLFLNGVDVTENADVVFDLQEIRVPSRILHRGSNELEVHYTSPYGRSGCGIHSYKDPKDGEQYLFTFFESPYAHIVFPCFDQPDLKATYTFTITVKKDWIVVSNEFARETIVSGDELTSSFFTTPKLSTYLAAFVAGPFEEIRYGEVRTDSAPKRLRTPMSLYCRASLAQLIRPLALEFLMQADHATRFFEKYMNVSYPYSKMDHVFLPEFNMGAMEQPGCITYTEKYIKKDVVDRAHIINVANTIMHEIAHQWFGNLVTMKWWDDLWLNEAFATYMACVAQESYVDQNGVRTGEEAWLYLVDDIFWGMDEDQKSTTHPVCVNSVCTIDAEASFDGISYGKGAGFLRTLVKYIGADQFRKGIRNYFAKYSGGNTELKDFLAAIDSASNVDIHTTRGEIERWGSRWLYHQGVVQGELKIGLCKDRKVESAVIKQSFCEYADDTGGFRSFRMDVMLFNDETKKSEVVEVLVSANEVVDVTEQFAGKRCDAFLANLGCHAFVKFLPDQESAEVLLNNYMELPAIDRYVLLKYLLQKVKGGEHNAIVLARKIAQVLLNCETLEYIQSRLIRWLVAILCEYIPPDRQQELCSMGIASLEEIAKCPKLNLGAGIRNQCVEGVISLCRRGNLRGTKGIEILRGKAVAGHELTEQQQMLLAKTIGTTKDLSSDDYGLIVGMAKSWDEGQDKKVTLRAVDIGTKALSERVELWDSLLVCGDISQEEYGNIAGYLFTQDRGSEVPERLVTGYFEKLREVFDNNNIFIAQKFARALYPGNFLPERDDIFLKLKELMDANQDHAVMKSTLGGVEQAQTHQRNAWGKIRLDEQS